MKVRIGMQSSVFDIRDDFVSYILLQASNDRHMTGIKMSNENSLRELLVSAQSFFYIKPPMQSALHRIT